MLWTFQNGRQPGSQTPKKKPCGFYGIAGLVLFPARFSASVLRMPDRYECRKETHSILLGDKMSTFIKLRYVLSASSFTVICLITLFGCNNSDPVGKVNSELNREQLERAANSNYFDIFRRANDLYITIGNSQSNPSTESILTTMNRTASMVSVADPSNVDPTLVAIVTEYSEKMYRLRGCCLKLSQSRSTPKMSRTICWKVSFVVQPVILLEKRWK